MIRALELGSVTAIVIFGVACKIVGSKDNAAVLVPVDITASTGIQKQVDEINSLTGYRSDSSPDADPNTSPSAQSGNDDLDEPGLAYSAVESVVVYKVPENKHSRNIVKTIDSIVDGNQGGVVSPTLAAVCGKLAEMPLSDSDAVDSAAAHKSETCGKRLSRFKVDAKELESDYRFLSEMVQEPYLTDADLRIVAAHETIRSYLESNLEVVEGKTEQYRLSWVDRGVQRSALLVFGIASQKIAILQYRTLNN
jgi:hypothetical protein